MKPIFPIALNLQGRACVVVGGGRVAERKAAALLGSGADVTIVSPTFTPQIQKWIATGSVKGVNRRYESTDGEHAFLIFAATDQLEVNIAVHQAAASRCQLINVADNPELSNFILPSVVNRGKLVIAVSTSGASPAAAVQIKKQLETAFGPEYEQYIDFLNELRLKVRHQVQDLKVKQQMLQAIVHADLLTLIRSGTFAEIAHKALDGPWLEDWARAWEHQPKQAETMLAELLKQES